MKTLITVSHMDDEVLGCGGWIQQLDDMDVLVLCRPERQTIQQFHDVAQFLGFRYHPLSRDFADQRLDVQALQDTMKPIEELAPLYQRIITHHVGDLNLDHRVVCQAVCTATRPPWRGEFYMMEIPSSTEWGMGLRVPQFQPNTFVELTQEQMDRKVVAMEIYESEIRPYPHPRSKRALVARAEYWGQVAGVEYAEPFQLVKQVK